MKEAIIWRESVYKNNFRCQICGSLLFNKDTLQPTELFMRPGKISGEPEEYGFCISCLSHGITNPVARIEPYSGDKAPGLHGRWEG